MRVEYLREALVDLRRLVGATADDHDPALTQAGLDCGPVDLARRTADSGSEALSRVTFIPKAEVRTGGVDPPQREARRYRSVGSPMLSVHGKGVAGRTRTCDPRLPGPVVWPTPSQPDDERRANARRLKPTPTVVGRPGSTSSASPSPDRSHPLPPARPRSTSVGPTSYTDSTHMRASATHLPSTLDRRLARGLLRGWALEPVLAQCH
jgi:hypothetical protein